VAVETTHGSVVPVKLAHFVRRSLVETWKARVLSKHGPSAFEACHVHLAEQRDTIRNVDRRFSFQRLQWSLFRLPAARYPTHRGAAMEPDACKEPFAEVLFVMGTLLLQAGGLSNKKTTAAPHTHVPLDR
jgi:hypothetical protein